MDGKDDGQSDADLLKLIGDRDHHAFRILLQRYSRLCYSLAYRFLSNREMAEDIVQDIMLKLWDKPNLWQERRGAKAAKFSTWLYRVTMNAAIDAYRKKIKETDIGDGEEFEYQGDSPNKDFDRNKIVMQINQAINTLPTQQNEAIILCRLEGHSHKDAGEIMGVSAKAVERLISRGVNNLRNKFRQQDLDVVEVLAN